MRRWIFLWSVLAATMGLSAAEIVGKIDVTEISATGATVRWRTDVPTGSRVDCGTAADRLTLKVDGGGAVTAAHSVTLTGLTPGTKYFFAVGTARRRLAAGEFVTSGATTVAPTTAPPAAKKSPPIAKPIVQATPPPEAVPPARKTWGNLASLTDHFQRHGADVAAKDADDYARKAWEFRQRARAGELQVKMDEEGVQRVFDPKSGLFAAYNRDGTTKTFFKPGSRGYFDRQPGQPVKAITP